VVDDHKTGGETTKSHKETKGAVSPAPPLVIQSNPQTITIQNTQGSHPQNANRLLKVLRSLRKRRRDDPKWTDKAIVLLTAGIVLLAFMQWWEMHDSGTQTDKIIAADERIAKAMENSVTQAQSTFDAANKQAILSQRAWMQMKIGIESPSHMWTVGQPIDIRIKQNNTGRTPALNLKSVIARTNVESKNGVFDPPPFSYKPEQYVSSGNLTPGGEIFSDSVSGFTAEDEARVVSMKVRVYVHGRVEYDDVFGVHHWLTFCSFLLPGQACAICPYHNEIDHNQ
jgi:hypothetical protein